MRKLIITFVTVLVLLIIFITFCFRVKLLWVGSENKRIVLSSQRKLSNYIKQISYGNKFSVGFLSFSSKQNIKDSNLLEEKNNNGKTIFYCGWSENNLFGFKIYNFKEYFNVEEMLFKYQLAVEVERRINETTVACLTKLYSENLNFSDYEKKYLENLELIQKGNENIFLFK